jgi:hypothetical protein
MYTYIYTYIHIYIYMYIYTRTHIYVCTVTCFVWQYEFDNTLAQDLLQLHIRYRVLINVDRNLSACRHADSNLRVYATSENPYMS